MATFNDGNRSFTTAAALSAYSRVTINSSSQIALATNDALAVGVINDDAASGDVASVRMFHKTLLFKAAGAITAGSQVYPATVGKISGSEVSNSQIGLAIDAATTNLDVIEVALTLN